MRKAIIFAILSVVLITTTVALYLVNRSSPPPWREAMNRYLVYREQKGLGSLIIDRIVRAGRPWNLTSGEGFITYGSSNIYQTDYSLTSDYSGSLSLPYPPQDMYCVLFKSGSSSSTDRLILVTYYQDLYNSDWVVHEPAQQLSSEEITILLTNIGCSK